jgi:hypothetical protein
MLATDFKAALTADGKELGPTDSRGWRFEEEKHAKQDD